MSSVQALKDNRRLIRAGWVLDGRGGPRLVDQLITVEDNLIISIAPYRPEAVAKAGPGAWVDLSGDTVLPPLIDTHVHLVFSGVRDRPTRRAQLTLSGEGVVANISRHLEMHRQNGVFTVRDGGDRNAMVLRYKNGRVTSPSPSVEIFAPSCAWRAKGRYGAMIGQILASGETGVTTAILSDTGCDHIKVLHSGINSLDCFGQQTAPQWSDQDLAHIRRAAEKIAKPVMVHANGRLPVRSALAAGCHSIEHGYFMGRDNLNHLADKGVYWAPTVAPMDALAQCADLTPSQRDTARRTRDHQLQQIHDGRRAGAAIVLGTDAGSYGVDHGCSLRQELALLVSAGLGLEAAVGAATLTAARLLGIERRGALKPGWPAAFLLLKGPPDGLLHPEKPFQAVFTGGLWRPLNASRDAFLSNPSEVLNQTACQRRTV